jgi:hypothetical protein
MDDIPTNYQALKAVNESYKAKMSEIDYEAKLAKLISRAEALDQIQYVHRHYRQELKDIIKLIKQRLGDNKLNENPRIIMYNTIIEVLQKVTHDYEQGVSHDHAK